MSLSRKPPTIDGLQYSNWSRKIFQQMRKSGLDAVHVTITYHENFRETVERIVEWNQRFEMHRDLIMPGRSAGDIDRARASGRTAVFFGSQNPSLIDDNIGLVQVVHELGLRFMQLTYNNQSLLAGGHMEAEDRGISRMGREVIREMNRVGLVIDMSHSAERSTIEAIERSQRPLAITHANPQSWHPVPRNKSDRVIDALAAHGGILGFSLYPHHMPNGTKTSLREFSDMAARLAERIGVEHIAIGSDLTQDQPDSVVEWMRNGRWSKDSAAWGKKSAAFPPPQPWFKDNLGYANLRRGFRDIGFSRREVDMIMGGNWYRFFAKSFGPAKR